MTWMPVAPSAQAQATTARLQDATRAGQPMMIPGAAPARVPAAPRPGLMAPPPALLAPVAAGDRQRLEYQREGGGAPSARRARRPMTLLARLWRRT